MWLCFYNISIFTIQEVNRQDQISQNCVKQYLFSGIEQERELRFLLDTNIHLTWISTHAFSFWRSRMDNSSHPMSTKPAERFLLLVQALQQLGETETCAYDQKRTAIRFPRSLSISVQPLDDDFNPDGESFWLVSRDISLKGIGLISCDPIIHRHVRLGLMDETSTVIGQVRHNSSIGQHYPLYLVGINFLNT
jgi:hypothetical protein